jgi:hypothetical protein
MHKLSLELAWGQLVEPDARALVGLLHRGLRTEAHATFEVEVNL